MLTHRPYIRVRLAWMADRFPPITGLLSYQSSFFNQNSNSHEHFK
jgi:hypothetical protein